jgi:hypothetical protein
MTQRWAVRLKREEYGSLQKLRLAESAEVCETDGRIWVRGENLDESLARLLRRHPHARRFWVLADDQLLSPGKLVPLGYLPAGPWQPLVDWLRVGLPEVGVAGRPANPVRVRLVRSAEIYEPSVLMTRLDAWHSYCGTAAQVRLDRWLFAAAADGRVVVRGLPLPPLPGERFVEREGIAVPAGYCWHPSVEAGVLRTALGLDDSDMALLLEDETWERIEGAEFVRATRSAVRATAAEVACD